MKAVVDRIVGEKAILLIGQEEKEYIVLIEKLPVNVKEGSILKVTMNEKDEVITISTDLKEEEITKRISNKMKELRQRKRSHYKRM